MKSITKRLNGYLYMTPYCTLTQATDYLDSIGINTFIGDDTLRTQCLNRATQWLDNTYGPYLPGQIVSQYQEQLYPRTPVIDKQGRYYPQDVIPTQVIQSVALMAQSYYNEETLESTPLVQREITTIGPITTDITYSAQKSATVSEVLSEVDKIMFGLIGIKLSGGSKVVYWS